MSDVLLWAIMVAAILIVTAIWYGLLVAWDRWRDHYQARRKHVLHTTAADERVILLNFDEHARRAAYATLREPCDKCGIDHTDRCRIPLTTQLGPPQVPHAAPDVPVNHPPLPAPVVELLGHATVDELVDSIVMRVLTPA